MRVDPCRNSACYWRGLCPLRPLPPLSGDPAPETLKPAPRAPRPTFSVRGPLGLPVGMLRLHGEIHEATVRGPLAELDKALPRLRGLLVTVNSRGGTTKNGAGLMLRAAARRIPVVAHIRVAYSAALEPAAACGAVFVDPDGAMGRAGCAFYVCSAGARARLILSAGAPEKVSPWSPESPPKLLIDGRPETLAAYQAIVDATHERAVNWVADCRGLGTDGLRPMMDGRKLDARQAVAAGLVDGITTEAKVFEILLKLAKTGRKTLF